MGRFGKLFGNCAVCEEAMADAFRIAKGFLPVKEFAELPTRLELPLVFVELEIPLLPRAVALA